jgi:2-keto-4-pentenoate hydratase/2-oxohepta-3-ene-1,7-dioic acid hydratase in catechol pathway
LIAPRPSKIVCLARTFRLHAEELGNAVPAEPLYFLKATSAVIDTEAPIRIPAVTAEVHHEGEAAVIVGQRLSRGVSAAEAESAISGWTVLNDVTARDLQRADGGRFTRAKGFDTFCPLGAVRQGPLDWRAARIRCWVDDALRQDGALSDLLFTPGEILAKVAEVMTLLPGDVVSLGTPAGVGQLVAGQRVRVALIDGAGDVVAEVANPVIDDPPTR